MSEREIVTNDGREVKEMNIAATNKDDKTGFRKCEENIV